VCHQSQPISTFRTRPVTEPSRIHAKPIGDATPLPVGSRLWVSPQVALIHSTPERGPQWWPVPCACTPYGFALAFRSRSGL
jgi:hypothetical protein